MLGDPPSVSDHQVPALVCQWEELANVAWDLTLQEVSIVKFCVYYTSNKMLVSVCIKHYGRWFTIMQCHLCVQ